MSILHQHRRHSLAIPQATATTAAADRHSPAYQAYLLLRTVFTVAPILFGIDKFFNVLTNWPGYLSHFVADITPGSPQTTMYMVGVIEIVAGIIVALRPRIGGYVVALWLAGIIINLLLVPGFYDVALRDFGLFVAALALARLSVVYDRVRSTRDPVS